MRSSHNRLPEVLAFSTALALTGCTVNDSDTPPTSPPSDVRIDNAAITQYFQERDLDDPCNPSILDAPNANREVQEKQADACEHIYKMGKVALVNYDVSTPVAENLAARTEALIRQASDDKITLDLTVVEPSQLARDKFKEANPDNCYNLSNGVANAAELGSVIANFTMPDKLNNMDYVVGLTSAVDCKNTTDRHRGMQGFSLASHGNRFIEILDADPAASHPEGAPFLNDASNLTHELFHNLGLGHAGGISYPTDENPFGFEQVGGPQKDIDLDTLLQRSQFNEYGDFSNTQGNNATLYSDNEAPIVRLNNIQLERLNWPEYIHSPESPRKEQLIGEIETKLDTTDPLAFASVPLARQVELIDPENNPKPQLFSKLAIISRTWNGTSQAELFLTNNTGFTARLGSINELVPNWNITVGGKLISLNYTNDGLHAKATDQ
jgi:hypothetical protein